MSTTTIEDKDTKLEQLPDTSKWAKVFCSPTKTGERTQVGYVEEIPQLEEPPEQITGQCLDLGYEFSQPGIIKAGTVELPVFHTHTQYKKFREMMNKDLYWFFQNPAHTAPTGTEPLVRYFKGQMYITMDTITVGEFLKDKMTLYKSTAMEESEGFPTATP